MYRDLEGLGDTLALVDAVNTEFVGALPADWPDLAVANLERLRTVKHGALV